MKKYMKRLLCVGMAASMVLGNAAVSMAGVWRQGAAPNENRWWYDLDNGSYATNGWMWIDGNNDGLAEYYYFDSDGWMLADTMTPDGNMVNANGAWVMDGIVQTQTIQQPAQDTQQNLCWMWKIGEDGSFLEEDNDLIQSDVQDWVRNKASFDAQHFFESMEGKKFSTADKIASWAQTSERGAAWKQVFDRYGIVPEMLDDLIFNSSYTLTTAPGVSFEDFHCICSALYMMALIRIDGLGQVEWNGSLLDDTTAVITLNLRLYGG